MSQTEWHVWKPFREEFSGNLAIFCSDERFADATLEFLRTGLGLERCDLFAVAGGPAFIVHGETPLLQRLDILVTAHDIQRIILITHADCGYYQARRSLPDAKTLKECQCDEACQAARILRNTYPDVTVDVLYAGLDPWRFAFSALPDGPES